MFEVVIFFSVTTWKKNIPIASWWLIKWCKVVEPRDTELSQSWNKDFCKKDQTPNQTEVLQMIFLNCYKWFFARKTTNMMDPPKLSWPLSSSNGLSQDRPLSRWWMHLGKWKTSPSCIIGQKKELFLAEQPIWSQYCVLFSFQSDIIVTSGQKQRSSELFPLMTLLTTS